MITAIVPKSEVLQKYIDFFYFFNPDKPVSFSYLAFPHIVSAITFFKGVDVVREDFQMNIQSNRLAGNVVDILGRFTRPVHLIYDGNFEEITIIFKPLGVNRFIQDNFLHVAPSYSQLFQNDAWVSFSELLFSEPNPIEKLEVFLLAQLNDQPIFNTIEIALRCFEDPAEDFTVPAVAALLGLNLKSFQRLFTKHMGCSPSNYKKIARFRNSTNSKIYSKQVKSLTTICHENNYFDQSYFIKQFKTLTHQNPKKFFKTVRVLDTDKVMWKLL